MNPFSLKSNLSLLKRTFIIIFLLITLVLIGLTVYFGVIAIWPTTYQSFSPITVQCFIIILTVLVCAGYYKFVTQTVLTFTSFFFRKKRINKMIKISEETNFPDQLPKVAFISPCCDDFCPVALSQTIQQTYPNIDYYILDDSKKPEHQHEVDEFAKTHNCIVVRRGDWGKKNVADNVNHFLSHQEYKWDYIVRADADVVLNKNWVEKSLKYFYAKNFKNVGVVASQTGLIRSENSLFGHFLALSDAPSYYELGATNYFDCMIPPGTLAIYSRQFWQSVDFHIPPLISDDGWIDVLRTKNDFLTIYSPYLMSLSGPMTITAFIKQQSRWKEGGTEIPRHFSKALPAKNLFQNIRIIGLLLWWLCETPSTFLGLISPAIFSCLGYAQPTSSLFFIISLISYLPVWLNYIYSYLFRINFFRLVVFLLFVPFVYGACWFSLIKHYFKIMVFRASKYYVTPKTYVYTSKWHCISNHWEQIITSLILFIVPIILYIYVVPDQMKENLLIPILNFDTGIPLFILSFSMIALCQLVTVPLAFLSNVNLHADLTKEVDFHHISWINPQLLIALNR